MAETIIPLGEFKAACPQCGAELGIERSDVEPHGDDALICPAHGRVGVLQEFRDSIGKKVRDNVGNAIKDALRKAGLKRN
jgi:hypothetical protein